MKYAAFLTAAHGCFPLFSLRKVYKKLLENSNKSAFEIPGNKRYNICMEDT